MRGDYVGLATTGECVARRRASIVKVHSSTILSRADETCEGRVETVSYLCRIAALPKPTVSPRKSTESEANGYSPCRKGALSLKCCKPKPKVPNLSVAARSAAEKAERPSPMSGKARNQKQVIHEKGQGVERRLPESWCEEPDARFQVPKPPFSSY